VSNPPKEFLRKIRPFSYVSEEELNLLVENLEVEAYEKGKVIVKKGKKTNYLYLVFSGLVGLYDDETLVDTVSRGELFGIISIISENPFSLTAVAVEDTICYLIKKDAFKKIFEMNPKFAAFFSTFINRRFRSFSNLLRETEGTFQEEVYLTSIGKLIKKNPVVCSPETTIEEAVKIMLENRVGSIVVVDENNQPLGILTDHDLRKVLISGNKNARVVDFMNSPVITISDDQPIFEAYLTLLKKGINHLVITKKNGVAGVITSKDILTQFEPTSSLIALYRNIRKATSVEELKTSLEGIRKAVAGLAMKGMHFYDLSRMITSVNDSVVVRTIRMIEEKFRERGMELPDYVWIHMGSSGRKEQIIATDQDNAIIHSGDGEVMLEFAREVNETLDYIGIPKCTANYMASNPKWNLTLDEWKKNFKKWFTSLTGENIRYLSVFLDLRPIHGDQGLYVDLLDYIKENITNQAIRFLALDATAIEPPVGIFGIKNLDKGIDLKKYGIYPIANGVRVMALEKGIIDITNTKERIGKLSELDILSEERSSDLLESYEFLQDLRLKHQSLSVSAGREGDNIIRVEELDKMDIYVLKESLKIVSSFQKFIKGRYGVERVL
jgi:CBS domain-containing protein